MASYKVAFKPSVEKDLAHLSKKVVTRILRRIELLTEQPFSKQSIKLEGSEALYRIRIGDYRIIYGVDTDAKQIVVHHVRHRREAYRRL